MDMYIYFIVSMDCGIILTVNLIEQAVEVLTSSQIIFLRKQEVITAHQGRPCYRKKKKKSSTPNLTFGLFSDL